MGVDHKMDFFTKDFLASTLTMTGPEASAYSHLLLVAWTQEASLPLDPERIRIAIRYDREDWDRVWPTLKEKWPVVQGRRQNRRQRELWDEAMSRAAILSESARKANAIRWGSPADPNRTPVGSKPDSPSPSPSSDPSLLPTGGSTSEEGEGAVRPHARSASFKVPTPKEISDYAIASGWTAGDWNTVVFFDFFEQKGWITGRTRMKDWKAAARNAHREGWTVRKGNGDGHARTPGAPSRPPGVTFEPDGLWLTLKGERFDREENFEKRGISGWYRSSANGIGEGGGMRLDGSHPMSEPKWTPTEYANFFRRHSIPMTPLATKLLAAIGCWPSEVKKEKP